MFRPLCLQWLFSFLSWILPVFSLYCCTTWFGSAVPVYLESPHFGLLSKVRFPLGSQHIIADMLLQHVAATDHSLCTGRATCCATCFNEKLFGVYWSLCLRNRILLPQRIAQIQIHLILRYLWPLVAATNFQFTQVDLSQQRASVTCHCYFMPSAF